MFRCPALLAVSLCLSALANAKPNVVMIISDDQTYRDFGFMGNDIVQTPHLDRLAAQSARYINGYVPTSVCSPSLATMLTGLYPHQSGIHYNHPPPGNSAFNRMTSVAEYESVRGKSFRLIKTVPTLPRVLASAGYRTLQTGKFWEGHYSNAGFTHGMTLFEAPIGQTFGGLRTLANGDQVAHGNGDWGLKIGRETMQPIVDFIDHQVDAQPFFIWYAPYLPHQPHDPPKQFFDIYRSDPNTPEHFKPYYAAISQFDATVGRLVKHVEDRGLADNTLFVFVIDNGWTPGTRKHRSQANFFYHTNQSKRSPFEDGLRTPILLRWDGVIQPAKHRELCSSVDLVPTILSACNLQNRIDGLPGINLMPSARGSTKLDARRPVFGEIYPGDASVLDAPSRDIAYRWVRSGNYKLIVPHRRNGEEPWGDYLDQPALFNVSTDPGETKNLRNEPSRQKLVKHLTSLLDDWWLPEKQSP